MGTPTVTILKKESYLATIKNAAGSGQYRNLYALVDGKKRDILRKGDLSCAYFVSSILLGFALIKSIHATVNGTVRDMKSSCWKLIEAPRPGCVVVWEAAIDKGGESHTHIGFYIGNGNAISNVVKKRTPDVHPYETGKRHVIGLYWHTKLK